MEKIGSDNVNTNCGHSVLLEHDYSDIFFHNSDNNNSKVNKVNERLENDKKFHTAFKTVDKWADSVSLRLPTGDDRKKIVDREITIHKVKYPFLPEQQIRGKVYKKFGIPTVMGGLLSRRRDPKKMADTKRWFSMQDLEVKSEIAAAETLDQVSINSQPTQIGSFVAQTTNSSIEELRSFDDSVISKESMVNLREMNLGDVPTQSFERDWTKKILGRELNANFATSDFPQSEKARGKKRKNNVSPGRKIPEGEGNWKKMKISVSNDPRTTGSNTSQAEMENSQGHDFVTLDHSYSSGLKKKSRKLPSFSEIARKSGQFFNENSKSGESPIRNDFEDKENEENRFGERDEGDVIILDEFSGLGKNIVLSPVVFSPVKKLANYRPETVEISVGKSMLKVNNSKSSRLYENSSKIDATAKLKDSTNFVSPKTSEISNNSDQDIFSPSCGSRRHNLLRVVDSLSNQSCEYDRDTTEISKFCTSANYFYNLELMSKNDLKIDKNAEEFEMREKVDEILQSLQNEPL